MLEDTRTQTDERRAALAELEQIAEALTRVVTRLRDTGSYHTSGVVEQAEHWTGVAMGSLREVLRSRRE